MSKYGNRRPQNNVPTIWGTEYQRTDGSWVIKGQDGFWYNLTSDGVVGSRLPGQTSNSSKPSGQPQQNKTPDPVVTKGHDYAGLAQPVRGMINVHTNLGVGHALRSNGLAIDFRKERDQIEEQLLKVHKTIQKRPRIETRAWKKTAQDLKRRFDAVADEFRHDVGRARAAAHRIREIQDMIGHGHGHIVHMEL